MRFWPATPSPTSTTPPLAKILFELAVSVQRRTGCHMAFINLSGGVGIPYRPERQATDIALVGEGCARPLSQVLTPRAWATSDLYRAGPLYARSQRRADHPGYP